MSVKSRCLPQQEYRLVTHPSLASIHLAFYLPFLLLRKLFEEPDRDYQRQRGSSSRRADFSYHHPKMEWVPAQGAPRSGGNGGGGLSVSATNFGPQRYGSNTQV